MRGLEKRETLQKCKKIKLVISDVDGVLTDGGMYYSSTGEEFKKFNTRDGMGVELLLKYKIKTILMTKENSLLVKKRAEKINAVESFLGVKNKEVLLPEICKRYATSPDEIAYIGDDVNDIEIMKKVGFSAVPQDGVNKVKKIANYTCNTNGGQGVLREVADLILSIQSRTND